METAAHLAMFSAKNLSHAIAKHTQGVNDHDAAQELYQQELAEEVLTLNDGKVLALLTTEEEIFRYRLAVTLDTHLSAYDHSHRYHQLVKEKPARKLSSVEEPLFLDICKRTHDLARFAETVVRIPSLRNLTKVNEALREEYTLEEIHQASKAIAIDEMESAWDLNLALSH